MNTQALDQQALRLGTKPAGGRGGSERHPGCQPGLSIPGAATQDFPVKPADFKGPGWRIPMGLVSGPIRRWLQDSVLQREQVRADRRSLYNIFGLLLIRCSMEQRVHGEGQREFNPRVDESKPTLWASTTMHQ